MFGRRVVGKSNSAAIERSIRLVFSHEVALNVCASEGYNENALDTERGIRGVVGDSE